MYRNQALEEFYYLITYFMIFSYKEIHLQSLSVFEIETTCIHMYVYECSAVTHA